MTTYLTTIAGNILVTSSTDISGQYFNTNTIFNVPIQAVQNTADGYFIFCSYQYLDGGLYVTSTLKTGYAYGINMEINKIYKLAAYTSTGSLAFPNITLVSSVYIRSSPATYNNAVIGDGPFRLSVNPINNDIYIVSRVPLNTIHCIPFSTGKNAISGLDMVAGNIYPLYQFASVPYDLRFNLNGTLFVSTSRYVIPFSHTGSNYSLYGITAVFYSYSSNINIPITNSLSPGENVFSTWIDNASTLYVGTQQGKIYIWKGASSSPTVITVINVTEVIQSIVVDNSYNMVLCKGLYGGLCKLYGFPISGLSSSTTVLGITASAINISSTNTIYPTILTDNSKSVANNALISSSAIEGGGFGVYNISLNIITGLNIFFTGSYGIRQSVYPITSSPTFLTVQSKKSLTIEIGNLNSVLAYSSVYSGGWISKYYYSINSGGTYNNFQPGNTLSYSFSVPSNTSYNVLIKSENAAGQYATAASYSVIVNNVTVPNPPTISSNNSTNGIINVNLTPPSFNGNSAIDGYYVMFAPSVNIDAEVPNATTSYSFSGLNANTYIIYASAHNSIGWSSYATFTVYVNTPPLDISINQAISSNGSGNILVSINDQNNTYNNAISYYYYLYINGTSQPNNYAYANYYILGANLLSTSTTTTFYISGLFTNVYTVYVIAKNFAGSTIPIFANVNVTAPPISPVITVANTITSGSLTVSFTDSSNDPSNGTITYSYYVYDASSGTNNWSNTFYYTNTTTTLVSGTTQYSLQIPGLINKTYSVYLRAKNIYGFSANTAPYSATAYVTPSNISFDTGNTSIVTVTPGNLKVTINDPSNVSTNAGVYYYYSINGGATYANSNVPNNGPTKTSYTFNILYTSTAIQTIYVRAQNYLGNSNIIGVNVNSPYNTSLYNTTTPSTVFIDNSTNYAFQATGFPNKTYSLYLRGKNILGYSANSAPYSVTVFVTPIASINIDAGNTKTVAAGNLQVRITDSSNTALNGIYYWYSLNNNVDASFANTYVKANVSPYTFFVPSIMDISNTIYVRASNTVGNSSPAPNLQVLVYQTPRTPPQVSFTLVSSGNVQVTITETAPIPYYYLNNVSYLLYAYNTFGGNNLSGNTSLSVYNRSVGVLANTNINYGNVVTYVNTGLNANTYTMYIIATNSVGNSTPISANIAVYTTPDFPPKIDASNSLSTSSGNLTVSFTDLSNNTRNAISYYYYVYDPSGANNSGNLLLYSNTNLTLTTGALQSFSLNGYGFINKTYTVYLRSINPVGNSVASFANILVFTVPTDISIDTANVKTVASGNLQVVLIDPSNGTNNGVYYQYSIIGVNGNAYNNANAVSIGASTSYRFYISGLTNQAYTINVKAQNTVGNSNPATFSKTVYITPQYPPVIDSANTLSTSSGNLTISFTDTQNPVLNDISYSYYLFDVSSGGTNQWSNTLAYTESPIKLVNGQTLYSFGLSGYPNKKYAVYLMSKNSIGYSGNSIPYNATVFVTPLSTIYIDAGNTKTVAAGNLQVRITDSSNTSLNNVYYQYSVNGNAYANTNVLSGTSPYTFFIPTITDISNTINVRASNTVGNSAPSTNIQVIVYQTPTAPPTPTFQLVGSGNVQVSITESVPMPYYYLNNVSYSLYAYNTFGGNNLSGNTSLSVYNRSVGVLANTNSAYGSVVSYINTGLNANTYTMYVIATNPFGNSAPISSNIVVYTTPDFPPKIDASNSLSSTAGNLTVSFTDLSNNKLNAISYYYYVYDPSGTNNSGNLSVYSNTNLTLTTGALQSFSLNGYGFINKTYTVYLRSINPVGNSVASFANILVFTVPTDISIDLDNTLSISSGNLQVMVVDPYNGTNNGVYYQYLVTGSTTYANAVNTQVINSTKRQFIISNLPNGSLRVYLVARNTVGNSNPTYFDQVTYVNPDGVPVIDPSNTLSQTSGNLTVTFTDASNVALNNVTYYYYLYDVSAGGTNYATNTYYYKTSYVKLQDGQIQYSFPITTGLGNKTYTLYLRANNNVGWSGNSAPYTVKTYTTPLATVYLDAGNTKTVASGNLKVVFRDASNIAFNGVSYQYSIDGTNYIRSNVVAGTLPYSFYIAPTNPPLDISNTIYVRATNQVGNSSPVDNLPVIVYRTPRTPPSVQFQLIRSGNVQVTITETPDSRPDYYYLNNVSYYLYVYNTFGGTNLSGNTSLAIYNRSVGILSNTNSSYGNIVTYVNTGLSANTYTMYVIATNPFGNSTPYSANVVVYTTPEYPPQIDAGNTISATSGNLTVSFTDPLNNPRNAISYWYYVYDPSGTNNFVDFEVYFNSYTTLTTGARQSFTIYGYTNKTYTLYLRSVNPVGNSTASSTNVTIYTVPTDISIDTANVKTVASGNLQVVLNDPSNGTNNGVYYQYSVIGVNGNAWINANAVSIGASTSYLFYISTGLTNQTYTINVKAQNTVGNSNPATFSKTVYITPRYPPTIDFANTLSKSSGNLTISFTDISNAVLNDIIYSYYLFDVSSGKPNQWSNLSAYIESPNKLVNGQTLYSFGLSGFPNKTYTLYLLARNSIGYSANTAPYNVTIFTTPYASVAFDAGNTKTIKSGNLQVSLVDPSNISLNQVYYWYSTTTDTPEAYSNSYVKSGVLPYRFYIENANPLLDISSTIYIKAVNTVGNSFPAINRQVIVYQTPYTPTNVSFVLVESGNVQVIMTENPDSLPDYYNLNNVSYYLYAYNQNSSDNGLEGNITSYTYPVGKLESINSNYDPIVSYVNTGLTANTYTMYVIAKNDFGYSGYFSQNIDVFTTPLTPTINTQTTISKTSGNLTVSFTDTVNNVYNEIQYLYYMYDPSYVVNDSGNLFAYIDSGKTLLAGGIRQSFDIYGYTNKIYTLYLLTKNPIGTSAPFSTNVIVYTAPLTPTYYDIGNTTTVSSGNLQVSFYDTVNPSLNSVYYWVSTDNGYTYSNSRVKNIDKTDPYQFVIYNLSNIRTNISIIAADPVGNSAPLTQTFTVLQKPRTPDTVVATLVQSGNVLLTVRESTSAPPANYYMNNVSYYYYLYTEGTGQNVSDSMSSYTNYIGSATDSNYADISIYVTGLPNKTSTFYVMAINDVGNSAAILAPVTVYVSPDTPPAFDAVNTYSVASGNLQVSFIDTVNTATNNAYYWYSIDGGNNYLPTNVKCNGPTTSSYVFYIPDLSNQDYTVSVIARNTVGSSSANTITKRVYITPQFAPIIDRSNTRSYSANYLTVTFDDTRNMSSNDIRYLYYLYDKLTPNNNNVSGNIAYYTESNRALLLDGTTKYSFDVSGLVNTTYTLYLLAKNTVGNSSTDSTDVVVYTIPAVPSIDSGNTKTVASGNVRITIIDTSNVPLNDVYYWYSNNGGMTFANTNIKTSGPSGSPYIYYVPGLQNQTYTWSIMAKNTVGNVVSGSVNVVSYTKPFPVGFDDGNTYSVATGNLQVSILDTSNIALNEVYYQYSIDGGNTYANTGITNIGPVGSPYVFWIPDLSNQTYTVLVKSVNRLDESFVSSISKMVYITPQYSPTLDLGNTISATSGNLTVAFDDTLNPASNNIQYWYYLYDPSNNQNDGFNPGAYTYTTKSLATNGLGPTHFSVGLSNLTNKTYTIYLLSKNTVGTSSVPVYANLVVYTKPVNPPIVDSANTRTVATGNLLVSFTDTVNQSLNNIYYWYSTNSGSSYANSFVKNAGPDNTAYSFYITGLTNANTTLSILSKNTVGNSVPSTATIKVYTTPLAIQSIDAGNTKTVASGNLQVTFTDTTNIATNDVYYWYSTYSIVDGESVFANSFAKNAGPAKSAYMFYVNGLSNSQTAISIKARNSTDLYIGESASVKANVIVYTTPDSLSSYSVSSSVSGNIRIVVNDPNNSSTNQVYYYVYYYRTGDTGPNNSTNISVYSNTYAKRIASSTIATFYLNDLSNNQYTVYVATKNGFGSNIFAPALPPIQVYTTPIVPAIDNANTLSKSSGNLTVSIIDTVNLPTNAVYYWYSINGGTYGNTGVSKTAGVSRYSYDIPTTQISNGNVYIVRVKTVNPIGESATFIGSNPLEVYTTPEIPVLYSIVPQDSAIDISFSVPYNNGNAISRYEYILNGTTTGTLNTSVINSQNTARITGLTNGTNYSVGVRAVNNRGSSGWSLTQLTTPFGVPFIPDVNAVPSDSTADIYFTTPNNNGNAIIRYEYSLYGGSLPISTIELASNNHYTVTGLTNGITYNVVVRAVNARGSGAWSSPPVQVVPYTNPSAPAVKLDSLSGAFRIYFDTPYDGGVPISYYQYTLDNGDNYTTFGGLNNNSVIVSNGVVDGTQYTVRVRTFNTNGRFSGLSSPVSITPFSIPVSPILQTAEAGIGTIPISFLASTYNGGNTITRYEYSTDAGNSFATMGIPTTQNSNGYITYEITYQSNYLGNTPLVNGKPYTIQLRAVNARGPSTSPSGSITVVPFNRPDPPTVLSATPGNHIISVSFLAPATDGGSPIQSYEYSMNGGARYDIIPNIDVTAKQMQFTITGLENGNVFSVSVRSRNSRGTSNVSNSIEAIPFGIPDPPIIRGVSKNTRVDIIFDTPNRRGKPIIGYDYFVSPIFDTYSRISSILPLNDLSQNLFTIYGLTNGETYTVNVVTVNSVGGSEISNILEIAPSTTPEAPTINRAIPLPGAIDIVFNTVDNTGGNTITGYKYAYHLGGL